jgi:cytochrome c oxidase cbb3-type subunit 3
MERAAAQVQAFQDKDPGKIDENNLTMPDAAGLAAGATIYNASCWSCHGKQLEGGAGPNLTDNYWIHKGSLTDVYMSIKHGYPDKGMQAWEKNFSPKEINQLAGYIKSMGGSNPPNAKLPQGDLYVEEVGTVPADSSAVKDSTTITKKI